MSGRTNHLQKTVSTDGQADGQIQAMKSSENLFVPFLHQTICPSKTIFSSSSSVKTANTCIYRVILQPNKIYRDHVIIKGQSIVIHIQPQQIDPTASSGAAAQPIGSLTQTRTILECQTFKRLSSVSSIFLFLRSSKSRKCFLASMGNPGSVDFSRVFHDFNIP